MPDDLQDGAMVRDAATTDAAAIADIYNHYISETTVTFEEEPVFPGQMLGRLEEARRALLPWLVAEQGGRVVGYAYASPWKTRTAYRFSVEITIYLSPGLTGGGIGTKLYNQLFQTLEDQPIHAVIAGIALPNDASVGIHQKFGMKKVAHFREVGFKFNTWIDVGYWQRIL